MRMIISGLGNLRAVVSLAALVMAEAGCSLHPFASGTVESPSIRTDQQTYVFRHESGVSEIRIHATFENTADRPVFVEKCGRAMPAFHLEKQAGEAWRRVYEPVCPRIVPVTVEVAPRSTYVDTVHVVSSQEQGGYPRFEADPISGTYRLVYQVRWAEGPANQRRQGSLVPLGLRVSNTFQLNEIR